MSGTRSEEKSPSTIPAPTPGTTAVLTATLSEDVKKTSVGRFSGHLGDVVAMTDAIETYRNNHRQGKTPGNAGIGAMASFVTEKLVEKSGHGLILAGMAVATTAGAPVVAPALAITTGVLLLAKSKEAGDLANIVAPILVDSTIDKFRELKASTLQFVKTAYDKFKADKALSGDTYPNVETAMVKLDYLQHLQKQGLYVKFDEQQRLLYNWIARETFSEYFQLNDQGKLKPTQSSVVVREIKPNGEEIKLELGSIYTSLSEVQKKCQLTPETILGASTISDKEMGEFLLSYGSTPEEVASLYSQPEHVTIAKSAVAQIKEQQKQLALTLEADKSLEILHGTQHFFAALSEIGMFSRSQALMTVGQVGFHTMQMATSIVRLSSMPISFASMEPMHMLISAGLGLISTVLGLGDDDDAAQRQAEQLHAALYAISQQIQGLHERFDHIEGMLCGLGGMINQVAYNQRILSDQLRETYKLVYTGFHVISTLLQDMRAENRSYHDRVDSQLKYLIGKAEQDGISDFQEKAKRRIKYISSMALTEGKSDAALARKEFKDLQSDIREACSPRRNGQTEFSAQDSGDVQRDLSLALNFLRRRCKENKDDGLGFIAEEVEQITKVPLITVGIRKGLLPATSIWSHLVFNYIQLAKYPKYVSVHDSKFAKEIQEQADNLMKFIQYLKTNNIIELLIKKHQQSIVELQEMMFERFDLHKRLLLEDKKTEPTQPGTHKPKMMRVGDYFAAGEDKVFEKMRYKVDHEYFLLQRLAAIIGVSPELQKQLAEQDSAMNLLTQDFDFTEKPAAQVGGHYSDSLITSTLTTPWSHKYPYAHEALGKFGGLLYGSPGEEKMLFVSSGGYSADQIGASATFDMRQFDLMTGKHESLTAGYSHVTDPQSPYYPRTFPLLEYKGNWNQTANHTWSSFTIENSNVWPRGPKWLVWFSGGSGYVSVFDMEDKQWKTVPGKKPFHVPIDGYPNDLRGRPGIYGGGTKPKMTCYTHLFHKDYASTPYLLVNRVEWDQEKKKAYVRFEVCDIQNKWLDSYEIDSVFNRQVSLEDDAGWILNGSDTTPTPNQFFIKMTKRYSFSHLNEDIIYGLINPKGNVTELQMHRCEVKPSDDILGNLSKPKGLEVITQSLPIAISEVYQTSSENMFEGYNSLLVLVSSVQAKDGKNKLLFIHADIHNKHYDTHEYELPIPGHPIADWQAMKTTVATIMGKPHLIVTLLDKDYHMMIFGYDPASKKVTRLANGPTLEFINHNSGPEHVRIHITRADLHLDARRKVYPGFYPVNTISIQAAQLGEKDKEMDTLLISYPKPTGPGAPGQYSIEVQRYPLAPVLKVKSTTDVIARLASAEEKAIIVPSKLVMTAEVTKGLLKEGVERKIEAKAEAPSENVLLPAIRFCEKIQMLMETSIDEFKYSLSIKTRIEEENQTIIRLLTELKTSHGDVKNDMAKLKEELLISIIQLNGYLSFDEKYVASISKSVHQQIDQLNEKIASIDKISAKKPSAHMTQSMFSGRELLSPTEIHSNVSSKIGRSLSKASGE